MANYRLRVFLCMRIFKAKSALQINRYTLSKTGGLCKLACTAASPTWQGLLRPYRKNFLATLLALFIAAGALLGFGVVL